MRDFISCDLTDFDFHVFAFTIARVLIAQRKEDLVFERFKGK